MQSPELKIKSLKRNTNEYIYIHLWVSKTFGKAVRCENSPCIYPRRNAQRIWIMAPKRFEWANISGQYKKERNDWKQLCPSCHRIADGWKPRKNKGLRTKANKKCEYCMKEFYPYEMKVRFCSGSCGALNRCRLKKLLTK